MDRTVADLIRRMEVLSSLAKETVYITDIRELFRRIMRSVRQVVDYDIYMCIIMQDKSENYLFADIPFPVNRRCVEDVRSKLLHVTNYLTRKKITHENLKVEFQGEEITEGGVEKKIQSYYNIPIIVERRPIGIISIASFKKGAYSESDIRTLYTIADQTSSLVQGLRRIIAQERREIESIIKSLGDGVVVVGVDKKIKFVNPAAKVMLEFKRNSSRFLEKIKKDILEDLSISKGGRTPRRREVKVGNTILELTTTALGFEEEPQGAVAVLRDVTRAREMDKLKNELISNVSHELRTPITTMKEFIAILLDGIAGSLTDDQKEYLSIVRSNINRLARIVSDLLDISRLESGSVGLESEPVNIPRLVRQVAATLQPDLEGTGLSLDIRIPVDLPSAYGDADRISQIFLNLITNATKHTPSGGKITVSGSEIGRRLQLKVSDTGEGIPKENLKDVFDRFQQLNRMPGPGAKGIGLGLAIAKQIVKMHKGRIWVESRGAGHGSTFNFTLPKLRKSFHFGDYIGDQIKLSNSRHRGFSLTFVEVVDVGGRAPTKASLSNIACSMESVLRSPRDAVFIRNGGKAIAVGLPDANKQGGLMFIRRFRGVLEEEAINFRTTVVAYPDEDEKVIKDLGCRWEKGMLDLSVNGGSYGKEGSGRRRRAGIGKSA